MSNHGTVIFIGGPLHGQLTHIEDRTPDYYSRTWDGVTGVNLAASTHMHTHVYRLFQLPHDPWLYVHESLRLTPAALAATDVTLNIDADALEAVAAETLKGARQRPDMVGVPFEVDPKPLVLCSNCGTAFTPGEDPTLFRGGLMCEACWDTLGDE